MARPLRRSAGFVGNAEQPKAIARLGLVSTCSCSCSCYCKVESCTLHAEKAEPSVGSALFYCSGSGTGSSLIVLHAAISWALIFSMLRLQVSRASAAASSMGLSGTAPVKSCQCFA